MGDSEAAADLEFLQLAQELEEEGGEAGCALARTLNTVERAVDLYGWERLAMTFNGGKDSTVMLHAVRLVALRHAVREGGRQSAPAEARRLLARMNLVYFDGGDDFEEVVEFTRQCSRECAGRVPRPRVVDSHDVSARPPPRFGMRLLWYRGSYKEGLARLIEDTGATAILMGTRRSDPHAGPPRAPAHRTASPPAPAPSLAGSLHPDLCRVAAADAGQPGAALGVSHRVGLPPALPPALRFTLRPRVRAAAASVPVRPGCSGPRPRPRHRYTSLGTKSGSGPNPLLRRPDGTHRPAFELQDPTMEREGRFSARSKRSGAGASQGRAPSPAPAPAPPPAGGQEGPAPAAERPGVVPILADSGLLAGSSGGVVSLQSACEAIARGGGTAQRAVVTRRDDGAALSAAVASAVGQGFRVLLLCTSGAWRRACEAAPATSCSRARSHTHTHTPAPTTASQARVSPRQPQRCRRPSAARCSRTPPSKRCSSARPRWTRLKTRQCCGRRRPTRRGTGCRLFTPSELGACARARARRSAASRCASRPTL